jgi:hypothetical protein
MAKEKSAFLQQTPERLILQTRQSDRFSRLLHSTPGHFLQ